ncbi:hypothetical protein [Rugosimonospora acidiphila]|uniref:hypothetical protein n=1 Tax=Rugosimonospora acidiphila TaxID=556531 RepID=UPI0031ED042C
MSTPGRRASTADTRSGAGQSPESDTGDASFRRTPIRHDPISRRPMKIEARRSITIR